MKKFNLSEFKKNPSRKVVTRDGRPARIICTDANCEHPIVALIKEEDNKELTFNFEKNGLFSSGEELKIDLFFATKTREGWVNIYKIPDTNELEASIIFGTKEEAYLYRGLNNYVATTRIEWEE